jgi:hypothetical protein
MKASMMIEVLREAIAVAGEDLDLDLARGFAISPDGAAFQVDFAFRIIGAVQAGESLVFLVGTDDEGAGLEHLGQIGAVTRLPEGN